MLRMTVGISHARYVALVFVAVLLGSCGTPPKHPHPLSRRIAIELRWADSKEPVHRGLRIDYELEGPAPRGRMFGGGGVRQGHVIVGSAFVGYPFDVELREIRDGRTVEELLYAFSFEVPDTQPELPAWKAVDQAPGIEQQRPMEYRVVFREPLPDWARPRTSGPAGGPTRP